MNATLEVHDVKGRYSLDDIDRRVMALVVGFPGIKQGAIAKELGLTRGAVNQRVNKPAFKQALRDQLATTDELITKAQTAALHRLIDIINNGHDKFAIEAAKVIAVFAAGGLPGVTKRTGPDPRTGGVEGVVFETQCGPDGTINRSMQAVTSAELPPASPADMTLDALTGEQVDDADVCEN